MTQTSYFSHGFTDMSVISRADPLTVGRGEGEFLFDQQGKRYLDASAALWSANIGHVRREISQAAYDQIAKLQSYSTFGDFTSEPAEALGTRIAGLSPIAGPGSSSRAVHRADQRRPRWRIHRRAGHRRRRLPLPSGGLPR